VAGGAKGFYILGLISEKKKKNKDALLYYKRSFKLDPSLWVAFEKICQLDIASTVSLSDLFSIKKSKKNNEDTNLVRKQKKLKRINHMHTPKKSIGQLELKEKDHIPKKDLKRVKTSIVDSGVDSRKKKMEDFIMKKYAKKKIKKLSFGVDLKEKKHLDNSTLELKRQNSNKSNLGLISKRSSPDVSKSNSKSRDIRFLKIKKVKLEENIVSNNDIKPNSIKQSSKINHMDLLKRYLMKLGYAYRMMTLGKFKESINIFNTLESSMLKLHFVLINTAICYMHLVKYKNAEKIFNYAFEKEPYESYGLDFYR
jgi:tetratricopeptide (TPR) repeat protein